MSITIKNQDEAQGMRVAGRLAAQVLDYLSPHVQPGVSTKALDKLALDFIINVQGCQSATVGYAPPGYPPFPGAICTSVNHVVCHGMPSDKTLKKGDILNIDVTVIKDGWHGDTSRMFLVGQVSPFAQRLCQITYECMWKGIEQVKPGKKLGDIGAAIQRHAQGHGYSVVREFCGHGIGQKFHEEPQILHYGQAGTGLTIEAGMCFTVEPMINIGRKEIRELGDGWTIVTKDHSLSAQWEHTVLVTPTGFEIMTTSEGAPAVPDWVHSHSTTSA